MRGETGPEPEEGRAGSPGSAGGGCWSSGSEAGGAGLPRPARWGRRISGRRGPGPPPGWRHPGRGAEGSGQAAPRPIYMSPAPGATSLPILRSHSLLTLPRCRLRPRSPDHGSVAATPPCPRPVSALTTPALSRSRLLSSVQAAAASPFHSHGVSNRSPLPLQPPFPPFRSARPCLLGLGKAVVESEESRSRRRRRGKTARGARDRPCALSRLWGRGGRGSVR